MSPNLSSNVTRSWLSRNNFKCCRYIWILCIADKQKEIVHSQAALFSNASSGQNYGYPLFPSSGGGGYSNASPQNLSYPKASPEQSAAYSRSTPDEMVSYPSSSPENLSTSVGSNHQEKPTTPNCSPRDGGDEEQDDEEDEEEEDDEGKPEYSNLEAPPHQSYPTPPQFSGFPSYQQTFHQVLLC